MKKKINEEEVNEEEVNEEEVNEEEVNEEEVNEEEVNEEDVPLNLSGTMYDYYLYEVPPEGLSLNNLSIVLEE